MCNRIIMETPYNKLSLHLKEHNCSLITPKYEYKNRDTPLKYIGICGHEMESCYKYLIKKKTFKCKTCSSHRNTIQAKKQQKYQNENTNFIRRIQKFELKFKQTEKYRIDFTPERYNKTLHCWSCKRDKFMRYFPYRAQYKDNKEKRCKNCNKLNNEHRRKNMTQEQFIKNIICTTRCTARRRYSSHREEAGKHTIDYDTIISMLEKQDGKCKLSGIPLEYKSNSLNNISIDRIDSNKGYTKDNIQLVTWAVNQSKNNLTNEQFLDLISKIYKHSLC